MTLERAGTDEAAWLAAVHAEGFARPWDAAAFADLLAQPGTLVLRAGWDGFLLARRALDEAEVLTLAVRADQRRRGVARLLVDGAAAALAAEGVADLHLEVAEDNPGALALYLSCGFEAVGRRPRYYVRGLGLRVDARVMRRRLTAPGVTPTLAV